MKRIFISSLESAVELLRSNPRLLSLPALQSLRPLVSQPAKGHCCGEGPDLGAYRSAFEGALKTLTKDQQTQMKKILGADEISYFSRVAGTIQQKSF